MFLYRRPDIFTEHVLLGPQTEAQALTKAGVFFFLKSKSKHSLEEQMPTYNMHVLHIECSKCAVVLWWASMLFNVTWINYYFNATWNASFWVSWTCHVGLEELQLSLHGCIIVINKPWRYFRPLILHCSFMKDASKSLTCSLISENLPTLLPLLNMLTHSLTGQSLRSLCSPSFHQLSLIW